MFGRHPQLPIDAEFGVRISDIVAVSTENYIQKLQRRTQMGFQQGLGSH